MLVVREESEINQAGIEEKKLRARKFHPDLGVRDHANHRVELRGLENDEGKRVPWDGLLFVKEGGHGLEDGDEVTIEKTRKEKE